MSTTSDAPFPPLGSVTTLKLAPQRTNESVINTVKDWLVRAEAGEIVSITAMLENNYGLVNVERSHIMSRLKTGGALLWCAMATLEDDDDRVI